MNENPLPRVRAWRDGEGTFSALLDVDSYALPTLFVATDPPSLQPTVSFMIRPNSFQQESVPALASSGRDITEDEILIGGGGIELCFARPSMNISSIEIPIARGFARVVSEEEVAGVLRVPSQQGQPIFDDAMWDEGVVKRRRMRAAMLRVDTLISPQSIVMTWAGAKLHWYQVSNLILVGVDSAGLLCGLGIRPLKAKDAGEIALRCA